MANNRYIVFEKQEFTDEEYAVFPTAALGHVIDQVSEDISEDHGFVYPETSAKRLPRNRLLGPRLSSGDVAVPMYTRGTPTLLYYALGKIVTTEQGNSEPSNFKHVITPDSSIPSFRMGVGKDLNEHKFVGCAVKNLKIDYTLTDPALATFELLVRKELSPPGDLIVPVFPDYDVKERTFLGTEVTTEVDGEAVKYVRSLSIELDNGLSEDTHSFGDRYLQNLRVQTLAITGSMTIAFDSIARYQAVLDEAEAKFEFSFKTGVLGEAGYREINIVLPKVSYNSANLPTDANNEYVLEVEFTAEVDAGESEDKAIVITAYNDETAAEVQT